MQRHRDRGVSFKLLRTIEHFLTPFGLRF